MPGDCDASVDAVGCELDRLTRFDFFEHAVLRDDEHDRHRGHVIVSFFCLASTLPFTCASALPSMESTSARVESAFTNRFMAASFAVLEVNGDAYISPFMPES